MTTKVAVIIPVYNNASGLRELLPTLLDQDYPTESYEIIVADNGSIDNTPAVAKSFSEEYPDRIRYVVEGSIQSSYAARNKGIEKATGELLVFTDADCVPSESWLKNGVDTLISEKADLAGGKIDFVYSKDFDPAELYDSLNHMQIEEYIANGKAITANLFAKKRLFNTVGLFPLKKSGADTAWTKKATNMGFKLVFAEDAVVKHPARSLLPLLKKEFRVGKGHLQKWLKQKRKSRMLYLIVRALLPPRITQIKQELKDTDISKDKKKLLSVWIISYLAILTRRLGLCYKLLKNFGKGEVR